MISLRDWRSIVIIVLTTLALVAATAGHDDAPGWEYLEVVWTHEAEEGRTSITYEIRQSGEPVEVIQLTEEPLEPAIDMLNRMGSKGWELTLMHESTSIWPRTTTYVFKRPLERP